MILDTFVGYGYNDRGLTSRRHQSTGLKNRSGPNRGDFASR